MSNSESSSKPPKDATHVWTDAITNPVIAGCHRLAFYKKSSKGEWAVYSPITGWRLSQNPSEWFEEETKQGFFIKIGDEA